MGTTVTILSQKGGTGKTTTVRTLADVFRRAGLEVLCVDLDPQGNLSDYFDVPADASPTVADVLAGQAKAADAVHEDILPANLGLAEAELILGGKMGRELTLRRALRELKRRYDLVLVDCPPSLGLLTVNALVAADHALISSEAEYFSLQGVEQALEVIELAKESLHPDLEWLGVVLNIADMRLVHSREALKQLQERFGEKVFATVIRRSVRYAESAERGVSIVDYAPDLGADYAALGQRGAGAARRLRGGARAPRRLARRARARVGCVALSELLFKPVTELARMVREGEITSRELVEASLERIEALQPELNAFVHVDAEGALATADAVGPGDPRPFAGVPIAMKDTTPVAGMPFTFGSDLFGDFVPAHDSFVDAPHPRRRLRDRRQDQHAGVRDPAGERAAPLRPGAQPVGHLAHPGRLLRRRGLRGGLRHGADRPRQRRRRLDPDPGRLLRPRGAEAHPRPRLARARAGRRLPRAGRRAQPHHRRDRASSWTSWPATRSATPPGRRPRPSRSPARPRASPGRCGSA